MNASFAKCFISSVRFSGLFEINRKIPKKYGNNTDNPEMREGTKFRSLAASFLISNFINLSDFLILFSFLIINLMRTI